MPASGGSSPVRPGPSSLRRFSRYLNTCVSVRLASSCASTREPRGAGIARVCPVSPVSSSAARTSRTFESSNAVPFVGAFGRCLLAAAALLTPAGNRATAGGDALTPPALGAAFNTALDVAAGRGCGPPAPCARATGKALAAGRTTCDGAALATGAKACAGAALTTGGVSTGRLAARGGAGDAAAACTVGTSNEAAGARRAAVGRSTERATGADARGGAGATGAAGGKLGRAERGWGPRACSACAAAAAAARARSFLPGASPAQAPG